MEKIYLDTSKDDTSRATVQIIGPSLIACAMESLVGGQSGYRVVRDGGQIVLLIGANGINVARKLRIHKSRKRSEQFVLIADGSTLDFAVVRDIPVRIFMTADESVGVLLDALSAAADGNAFCSAQMVPMLVESARSAAASQGPPSEVISSEPQHLPNSVREPRTVIASSSVALRKTLSQNGKTPFRAPSAIVESAGRVAIALGLNEREWEVVALAVEGLTNIEISEKTAMSVPSVKFLLYRAYQKLGIRRRAQLATALMIVPAEALIFATGRKQTMARHNLRLEAIRAAS